MSTPTPETAAEPQSTVLSSGLVLPELLWMLGVSEDAPLRVEEFLKIVNIPGGNKPCGGLWTSPVYEEYLPDRSTWWSLGGGRHRNSGPLWTVLPHVDTRVWVIDSTETLEAALDRWPYRYPPEILAAVETHPQMKLLMQTVIDYEAMAVDYDAVWLTGENYGDFDSVSRVQGNLWGWDGPSVLFLNPTFTVGRQWPLLTDEQITALETRRGARMLELIEAHYADLGAPVPEVYYRLYRPPTGV